jgi:hypothetical protein
MTKNNEPSPKGASTMEALAALGEACHGTMPRPAVEILLWMIPNVGVAI